MAVWQFSIQLVPEARIIERFGRIPTRIARDAWDSAESSAWGASPLSEVDIARLDAVLPRLSPHWSDRVSAWGSHDGDIVECLATDDQILSVWARIDVRRLNSSYLPAICEIAQRHRCWLVTEDLMVIEPELDALAGEIRQSSAMSCVSDPQSFLNSFAGLPRFF